MVFIKIVKCVGIFIICGILILIYAFQIEPYLLNIKHHRLGNSAPNDSIRVVQVSDIQISKNYTVEHLKKLVEKINDQKPDIFVFTGDLYENYASYGPEEEVIEALRSIKATYGKFAIWGNRDYGGGGVRRYEKILESSGITLLTNSDETITTQNGDIIWIGGIDDYLLGEPDGGFLVKGMEREADYRILMTHEPDTADFYTEHNLDLILAGHSHGGQVRLPFWEGITTSMADKYREGFYDMDNDEGTFLYVNTGIGTSHYSVRFGVPPEITVFDIGL